MRRLRASWVILVACVLAAAAVPGLREQARAVPWSLARGVWPTADCIYHRTWAQTEARRFVERHQPDDPDLLLGAAVMMAYYTWWGSWRDDPAVPDGTRRASLDVLEKATAADGTPAAWAARTEWLLWSDELEWGSVACSACVSAEGRAHVGLTDGRLGPHAWPVLRPEDARLLLDALHGWRAADPENALPVALEAGLRYGLTGPEQARRLWHTASTMPVVSSRLEERREAVGLFLERMGFPRAEAEGTARAAMTYAIFGIKLTPYAGAHSALHQGLHDKREGRPDAAIRLWNATIEMGRRWRAACDTDLDFWNGSNLEKLGAEPSWRLCRDTETGVPGGPFDGGRFWYGDEHAFYAGQIGEAADEKLRDRLVQNQARIAALSGRVFRYDTAISRMQGNTTRYLRNFIFLAVSVALLACAFAIVSLPCRASADSATTIGPVWRLFLILTPVPLSIILLAAGGLDPFAGWLDSYSPYALWCSAAMIPALGAFLALLPAIFRRRESASIWWAWRGNVRAAFPPLAALLAVGCIALGLHAAPVRARLVSELARPELPRMVEELGTEWTHPTIPPDAWRAEYPPG
jgi:hypothetical protein